jgi:hypothetical protein
MISALLLLSLAAPARAAAPIVTLDFADARPGPLTADYLRQTCGAPWASASSTTTTGCR